MNTERQDDLYADRVNELVYRFQNDIKSFAERERKPYEEVRYFTYLSH